jgi:hypothetical protein
MEMLGMILVGCLTGLVFGLVFGDKRKVKKRRRNSLFDSICEIRDISHSPSKRRRRSR